MTCLQSVHPTFCRTREVGGHREDRWAVLFLESIVDGVQQLFPKDGADGGVFAGE